MIPEMFTYSITTIAENSIRFNLLNVITFIYNPSHEILYNDQKYFFDNYNTHHNINKSYGALQDFINMYE